MRLLLLWFGLAFLWGVDATLAWRKHDTRQALVAGVVAFCFLLAGIYLQIRERQRRR